MTLLVIDTDNGGTSYLIEDDAGLMDDLDAANGQDNPFPFRAEIASDPIILTGEQARALWMQSPFIRIYETHYLADSVVDGDHPRDDVRISTHTCDDVDEAVRILNEHGVTFAATGSVWAEDPDGSRTVNYGTGEEVETSAFLVGFDDEQEREIRERVG